MTDASATAERQYRPLSIDSVRVTTREFVAREKSKPSAAFTASTTQIPISNNSSTIDYLDPAVRHVSIDADRLTSEITEHPHLYHSRQAPSDWAQWYHYRNTDSDELTLRYILVLDALNFCFWPLEGYEYAQLASSLKLTLLADTTAFDPQRLLSLTPSELERWLQPLSPQQEDEMKKPSTGTDTGVTDGRSVTVSIPLLESRCRALNELGFTLIGHFDFSAVKLVQSAEYSATALVALLIAHLPAFRDHAIDPVTGSQCFFYKRAQICVADVWGCYRGEGLGRFDDIEKLTCFADYRLPQLLSHIGILRYSPQLTAHIDARRVIESGSAIELSIRAHTVQAVEMMRAELLRITGETILSIQLDWILWERGESLLSTLQPHHRTRTIYY